jgi:hypothetical protein
MRPTDPKLLDEIKEAARSENRKEGPKENQGEGIEVLIDYREYEPERTVYRDVREHTIGLIMCGEDLFSRKRFKNLFYHQYKPVLQLGTRSLQDVKRVELILTEPRRMEVISATIFDVASHLGLDIELYDYEPDGDFDKLRTVHDHYGNLAEIFSRKLTIRKERHNPIRQLRKEEGPFLHVIPFTEKVLLPRWLARFTSDADKLYFKLSANPQLFIPVEMDA